MSEMGESYDPGPWKGFNYKSARAKYDYDSDAGRGYGKTSTPAKAKSLESLVPEKLVTACRSPLIIITDGTGSMGEYPEVMFKKLPLLDLGIEDYLEDCEISFAMIGDAGSDNYPLQVQPFTKGKGLVDSLGKLVIEKGGGSNEVESYDLAALYYLNNVDMPKATKQVLIFVCDEGIYSMISKDWAKNYAHVDIDKATKTRELFDALKQKYSVWCIRKHYAGQVQGETMTGSNKVIHEQWQNYLGAEKIAILDNPQRVVDVIFGLMARETNREEFFAKELAFRQKPEQVAEVQKSMLTIGKDFTGKKHTGKSILVVKDKTKGGM